MHLVQLLLYLAGCLIFLLDISRSQPTSPRPKSCDVVEVVTKVIVAQPIYINTFAAENTSFAVNRYLTLTVNDAPTSFDEVVTGMSTTFWTRSVSVPRVSLYNSRTFYSAFGSGALP